MPLTEAQYADILLAERRLRHYIRLAWHVMEPSSQFVSGFHIDAICEHVQAVQRREIRNLLVTVPPRHSKSTCVSIAWPTWAWINDPGLRFMYASYAGDLSTKHSLDCRRLLESDWYQARWGDRFRLTTDQNIKTFYENDKRGYRIATSVGGSVTGFGADFLVCDDPHNLKEIESDTIRESAVEWYDKVWKSRLNDPKRGCKVIIMQRGHAADLAAHVLREGGWEHLNLPTEYEPTTYVTRVGWKDPRTDEGQLLCPERFGPDEVTDAKKNSYAFAAQHQQRPAPAEGGRIKRVWFRYWHRPGTNPGPVPVRTAEGLIMVPSVELPTATAEESAKNPQAPWDEILMSWDMSFKDKERRGHAGDLDYVAGGVWARKGADKYMLDLDHERRDFPSTLKTVRAMCAKWPQITTKLVEDKANGSAVIDSLKHEIGGFIPIEPMGGKPARVAAASPQIESGNVYLPHPAQCPWTEKLILESITFPNAAHDDILDQMTQALIRMEHAKVQVYAFDAAGKPITGEERTMTASERFLRGMSPTDPIPEPSEEKPKDPRDGMTPEQRYELGLD